MNGRARLAARSLDMELAPLAFWDGAPGRPGGTASFVSSWERAGVAVRVIPVSGTSESSGAAAADVPDGQDADRGTQGGSDAPRQEIKAMLFADVVGYSRLPEERIPRFVGHFMQSVSQLVAESADAPIYANTWGDALYFVFNRVDQAGRFALALRDLALATDCVAHGLLWEDGDTLRPLSIRIGLHAGPVHVSFDPVVRQMSFTGAHVNRAARIEPVTEAGRAFVSEEFAALAAAEGARGFACEFVGTVPLAKNYGMARLYDLRSVHE
jgi:class 3 adenylate cyclase